METMSEKVGAMGGNKGGTFDDGVFDGVKKIIVGKDFHSVTYIKIEYGKDGIFETREHGTIRGELKEFTVDYPNEYITSVGGSYQHVFCYGTMLIKSLIFKTSYGRTSPILGLTTLCGNPSGIEFMLEGKNGGKLLGFHGRSGQALDAIGPHFFAVKSPLKQFKPQGGNGGSAWDDGAFDGVRKVLVGRNGKFVSYVRFEYAKGETMVPHDHGKRQGVPQEFVVDYPKEHITLVEGTIDGYISSLKFKTSKGRTSPAFGNVVGREFVLEEKGFKLVGFCGRSGLAIDALGAQFAPLPAPVPTPAPAPSSSLTPPNKGNKNSVSMIYIAAGNGGIEQIKFYNVENGETKEGFYHDVKGKNIISTFVIRNPPNEYLVSVESWYDSSNVFQGIKFETDKNSSEFFGYKFSEDDGTPFSLQVKDKKIFGVHKFADSNLSSPGTYFVLNKVEALGPGNMGPLGGNKGNAFNDGRFDGVKKITVGADEYSVTYIKIEYVKDGKVVTREHGTIRGELKVFSVDYPKENITAVGGSYDHIYTYDTTLITSLYFTTSNGFTSPLFGKRGGKDFNLKGENGGQLIGFHGRGGTSIDAIGAYFDTGSKGGEGGNSGSSDSKPDGPGKTGLAGGISGKTFDDGRFDGVKKITVGADEYSATYIKIEYVKDGNVATYEHGTIRGELKEFSVDYPKENITAVGGSYDHIYTYDATLITSLYFTTSNGFTSPLFGKTGGKDFILKGESGEILVGFHGRDGTAIDAIGAYFDTSSKSVDPETQPGDGGLKPVGPGPNPGEDSSSGSRPSSDSSTQKLDAQGGKGGNQWDDGGDHDGVTKIHLVGSGRGIDQIKFDYLKSGQPKEGTPHGVKGRRSFKSTIEIHPDEYLVSVKGWYDSSNVIQGLQFQTSTKTSDYFVSPFSGDGTEFSLKVKDKKIVGFHGFADSGLNSLGAYFTPISLSASPRMLPGKWIQVEQKGKGPGPRCSHAIAMVGDKMYSFGGELTPNFHIDRHLYVFDFKTHTWSLAPPNGDVPELPCLGVCMVAIGTTLYSFGGRDGHRNYNGFYSYDTVKSEWKLITHVSKGPAPRSFHSMAADDKNVYVFGGVISTMVRVNTLHAYNIVDQKWTELPNPGESCKGRGGSGLAVVQGKIWVVYGFSGDEMDDVHCFDPVESKWSKVETRGEKPWARSVFAIAVLGKYIIISGGEIEMDPKAHLGPGKLTGGAFVLDTESLMWEKLEEGHSPRGWCASTTASINGKKGLLMYGGKSPTNGRYDDIFFYGVDSA